MTGHKTHPIYDRPLRAIGSVTVSLTFLDAVCDSFLGIFGVTIPKYVTVGWKITRIEKEVQNVRLDPCRAEADSWLREVKLAIRERNELIHSLTIYTDQETYVGLSQLREGKLQFIDPERVEALSEALTRLAMAVIPLKQEIASLLGRALLEPETP